MFNNYWNNLSTQTKGIIYIAGGSLVLFYTLGIMQKWITFLMILAALAAIAYGLKLVDAYKKIMNMINKNKKQ